MSSEQNDLRTFGIAFLFYQQLLANMSPEERLEANRQAISEWIVIYVLSLRQQLENENCQNRDELLIALNAAENVQAAISQGFSGWTLCNDYRNYLNQFVSNNQVPALLVSADDNEDHVVSSSSLSTLPSQQMMSNQLLSAILENNPATNHQEFDSIDHANNSSISFHVRSRSTNCPGCGKFCHSQMALCSHLFHNHQGEKLFECDECQRRFSRPASLTQHKRRMHRSLRCQNCGRGYESVNGYKMHRRVRQILMECRLCAQNFASRCLLEVHYQAEHSEALIHQCPQCNERFLFPLVLRNHIRNLHS